MTDVYYLVEYRHGGTWRWYGNFYRQESADIAGQALANRTGLPVRVMEVDEENFVDRVVARFGPTRLAVRWQEHGF